jgi:predicted nucleic acid-binding Zn ribbon protein
MPVYVYRNLTTGETFEVEQRMTESALTLDPTTGDPVKRLVQPVGIAFKGSGFYVTDSRSNGKRSAAGTNGSNGKSEAGAAEPKSGADGASSDATPAASSKESGPAGGSSTKPSPPAAATKASTST